MFRQGASQRSFDGARQARGRGRWSGGGQGRGSAQPGRSGSKGRGAPVGRASAKAVDMSKAFAKHSLRKYLDEVGAWYLQGAPNEAAFLQLQSIATTRQPDNCELVNDPAKGLSMAACEARLGAQAFSSTFGSGSGEGSGPELRSLGVPVLTEYLASAEGEAFVQSAEYLDQHFDLEREPEHLQDALVGYMQFFLDDGADRILALKKLANKTAKLYLWSMSMLEQAALFSHPHTWVNAMAADASAGPCLTSWRRAPHSDSAMVDALAEAWLLRATGFAEEAAPRGVSYDDDAFAEPEPVEDIDGEEFEEPTSRRRGAGRGARDATPASQSQWFGPRLGAASQPASRRQAAAAPAGPPTGSLFASQTRRAAGPAQLATGGAGAAGPLFKRKPGSPVFGLPAAKRAKVAAEEADELDFSDDDPEPVAEDRASAAMVTAYMELDRGVATELVAAFEGALMNIANRDTAMNFASLEAAVQRFPPSVLAHHGLTASIAALGKAKKLPKRESLKALYSKLLAAAQAVEEFYSKQSLPSAPAAKAAQVQHAGDDSKGAKNELEDGEKQEEK